MLTALKAQILLSECTGDTIWPIDMCHSKGIPESWIAELADVYESGFRSDDQTIHHAGRVVNQFEGVRDIDLAVRLAEFLGVDAGPYLAASLSRAAVVHALKEAVEEL
jgi:hypothetical protein